MNWQQELLMGETGDRGGRNVSDRADGSMNGKKSGGSHRRRQQKPKGQIQGAQKEGGWHKPDKAVGRSGNIDANLPPRRRQEEDPGLSTMDFPPIGAEMQMAKAWDNTVARHSKWKGKQREPLAKTADREINPLATPNKEFLGGSTAPNEEKRSGDADMYGLVDAVLDVGLADDRHVNATIYAEEDRPHNDVDQGGDRLVTEAAQQPNEALEAQADRLTNAAAGGEATADGKAKKQGWRHMKADLRVAKLEYIFDSALIDTITSEGIDPKNIGILDKGLKKVSSEITATEQERRRRSRLVRFLRKEFKKKWPNADIILFGSSGNGLDLKGGDVDVCLSVPKSDTAREPKNTPLSEKQIIQHAARLLRRKGMQNLKVILGARVPIVKFYDSNSGFNVDLCANNELATHNTALIRKYVRLDWRVQPLIVCLKWWAKARGINDAFMGTLSSYAYALLMLHFLMRRPVPVLPCLQQCSMSRRVDPDKLPKKLERGWNVYFDWNFEWPSDGSEPVNTETLGQLMLQFFWFYAFVFDFNKFVVSARTGRFLDKTEKKWDNQEESKDRPSTDAARSRSNRSEHLFCIEDPFEQSHDLGKSVFGNSLTILKDEFVRAVALIREGRSFDDLCEPVVPEEDEDLKDLLEAAPELNVENEQQITQNNGSTEQAEGFRMSEVEE